jgi:hypothetical protein
MVDKVFRRVFEEEPNLNLLWEFMDYCDGVGLYSDEGMQLAYWKQKHEELVRCNTVCKLEQMFMLLLGYTFDLVAVWHFMDNDTNGLARLAIHIYSIITNSGAIECNFSDFGNIQTKKQSRLSVKKTHKINIVRMDIRQHHASLGLLKCRSKCKLGNDDKPTVDESSDAKDDGFEAVMQNLIGLANDNTAADANAAADTISAGPASAAMTLNPQGTHRCSRTQIPLATLFDFTH